MIEKSSHDTNAARSVKKITLPDGFRVGIINLDVILKEVADLKLVDTTAIKAELLKKVAIYNYIPSSAEADYSVALFKEYQREFVEPGATANRDIVEKHQHTKG